MCIFSVRIITYGGPGVAGGLGEARKTAYLQDLTPINSINTL
jgi:hypothetical protein